jgi:short-subunit dehydrogenase
MKFATRIEASSEGLIVSINSMLALTPIPLYHSYVSAKSALRSYVQSLRISLRGTKVRCVNVYPAFIRTEMIANVTHPKPLEMTPERMAQKIIERLDCGFKEIYIPIPSGLLMRFATFLPNFLYNRLFERRYFGRFFDIAKYHSSRVTRESGE